MPSAIHTLPFADLVDELDGAVNWFESVGARVDPTRLGSYRRTLRDLADAHRDGQLDRLRGRQVEIITALYEAHELLFMHGAFGSGEYGSQVGDRVRQVAGGTVCYASENSSSTNRARNLAFELNIAQRFVAAGLALLPLGRPDVGATIDGHTVIFECKRPQSLGAIDRNAERAADQLRAGYRRRMHPRMRGIIALDVTKAINPDFGELQISSQELSGELVRMLKAFVDQHAQLWADVRHPKTLGVLVRLSAIASCADIGAYVYGQQLVLSPFWDYSQHRGLLDALHLAFSSTVAIGEPRNPS